MTIAAGETNDFTNFGKYMFVAGTVSSSVTTLFSIASSALVQCPFDLSHSKSTYDKHGNCLSFFKTAVARHKFNIATALVPVLIASPFLTAQFSNLIIGRASSPAYSPDMAVLSGWCGSTIALISAASMAQSKRFQGVCWYKRFGVASKIGSTGAALLALLIARMRIANVQ